MEDEERKWKEIGEIKNAAVNIKHSNEASSEWDLDIENVDLFCKNRERQVMKCDKALESVATKIGKCLEKRKCEVEQQQCQEMKWGGKEVKREEYNILGQKNFGTKESTTSQHEIFAEQKRSISSLEATNESQEKDAEERPTVEILSEQKSRKEKPLESENDSLETTIIEKDQFKPLGSENLKEVELKPHEAVMLENNVSTEYEQEAKTVQCETSDIYSDRIISETARQENLRQDKTVINGNHKSDETFQTGIFYFDKKADLVSTSVTTTPAALTTIGTTVADHLTRTEDLEETKTIPFEDVMPDGEVLEEYSAIISKEPTT
ncbi:unnamed protein product, partial [Onchocerca ochengi]|uniref:Uncharacterized protein n=1 Tax=Onchocerca ochengi TaxID=42157 RepID=A0A182E376_ONCOC